HRRCLSHLLESLWLTLQHFDAAERAPSTASKADIARCQADVRFTPKSGHRLSLSGCPLVTKVDNCRRSAGCSHLQRGHIRNAGPLNSKVVEASPFLQLSGRPTTRHRE